MFAKIEYVKYEGKDAVIATVPNYQYLLDGDGVPGDYVTIIFLKEAEEYRHRQYPEPHEFPKETILLLKGHLTAEGAEEFHNKITGK